MKIAVIDWKGSIPSVVDYVFAIKDRGIAVDFYSDLEELAPSGKKLEDYNAFVIHLGMNLNDEMLNELENRTNVPFAVSSHGISDYKQLSEEKRAKLSLIDLRQDSESIGLAVSSFLEKLVSK